MNIAPLQFYKCLSDETRLSCILLIHAEKELCVCELTEALNVSQPKVSRHLAQLRLCGLLSDRKEGQWVFYKINPLLPSWAAEVLTITLRENDKILKPLSTRLGKMGDRPQRKSQCC